MTEERSYCDIRGYDTERPLALLEAINHVTDAESRLVVRNPETGQWVDAFDPKRRDFLACELAREGERGREPARPTSKKALARPGRTVGSTTGSVRRLGS